MKIFLSIAWTLASCACAAQFSQHPNAALAGPAPSGGIVFSPSGGSSFGGTQFVGLSYPTVPSASILYTVGTLCSNPSVACPVGNSVLSLASTLYTGPSCTPTPCTSGSTGFGSAIAAPVTGAGTTINALVITTIVAQQNNLSTTSLPSGWFPGHWKYITPNTKTTTNSVTTPTTGSGCGGPCAGNVLVAHPPCYLSITAPATGCTGGGVGSKGTIVSAWVVPNATPPVTPPIDASTGLPAKATYIGFTSSAQDQSGYGHPQILYTETSAQNCGTTTICTWQQQDLWLLADGNPIAATEVDMQQGDSVGAWTSALQCRIHGNASPLTAGWGWGAQSGGLTQITGTSVSNCPSSTAWLHVMYLTTFDLVGKTYTIQNLTLQSAPGGPAGSTGLAVFPVNKTIAVDPSHVLGTSCTNQIQVDQWCASGSVCNTTLTGGIYVALNTVHCGTGPVPITPITGPSTQVYQ